MFNEEFEDFLREQVSQHRMYPSDGLWKNIRKDLHGYTKWPALSVVTVVIIAALVIGTVLNRPQPDVLRAGYHFELSTPSAEVAAADTKDATPALLNERLVAEQITRKTIVEATENMKIETALLAYSNNPSTEELAGPAEKMNISPAMLPNVEVKSGVVKGSDEVIMNYTAKQQRPDLSAGNFETAFRSILFKSSSKPEYPYTFNNSVNFARRSMIADLPIPGRERTATVKKSMPLEKLKRTSSRFDFRFYVTPSVSYRFWNQGEDAGKINTNAFTLEANYAVDPEKAIRQRPAAGYETGFGLGYSLSKRISLVSGFQFNISQYKVDAFSYNTEPVSIAVLNEGFASNSIAAYSSLRSIAGSSPITLTNRYYEISMPVGIDWKILNRNRITLGVGAAIQPTYTFDKEPLIISSNFKNYTDGSKLMRNWNANANVETYFGYSTGNYRWQIGPEFRYQLLPTFMSGYPNKEYLFNYGVKVGVVKSLK